MVTKLTETNFFFHRNESFGWLPLLLCIFVIFAFELLRAEIFGLFSASIGAMITYGYSKCSQRLPEHDKYYLDLFKETKHVFFKEKLTLKKKF